MKKTLTVFSTLFAVLCLSAQTPEQSARIQEIKADETKYFYGESTSLINNADAFNAAIQDMSRQVKSTVDLTITEMNDRYDTESIIRSAAAFNNVNKIDYSTERNGQKSYVTFVYISKADYIKQLKESEAQAIERINNLIEEAIYQEGKVNIADALRNLGWALQLAKQYKYNTKLELTDNRMVQSWLDDKIKSILESIEVVLEDEKVYYDPIDYDHYTINIYISYGDRPVSHLDINYFNNEENRSVSVKNGRAALKYPKLSGQKNVSFNIRYRYDNPDEMEEDMVRAFKSGPKISYDRFNTKTIPVKLNDEQTQVQADANGYWGKMNYEIAEMSEGIPARVEERYREVQRVFIDAATESADLLTAAADIEKALRSRDYESVYKYFTPEALVKFQMMTNAGQISVSKTPQLKFERATHYIRCSSIPVSVKNGKHSRNESIVLRFGPDSRLVESIGYALTDNAENDIFRSADWQMDSRYAIVKFMEDYQTAYTTKDKDYLDMVFNGDAIIITGSVSQKQQKNKKFMKSLESNDGPLYVKGVFYENFNKDQFLKNLEQTFAKNSYIHLKYHDAVLTRAVTPPTLSEAFWIQLKQDYNSSSYNDKGFLTLQVGMKPSGAEIYVRTWTPNRVSLSRMKSLFPLSNFDTSL